MHAPGSQPRVLLSFPQSSCPGCSLLDGDLIKQVKEANDIVSVVGSHVTLHPRGSTFFGLCPFHDDHRPSFDVDPRRGRYRCWSCEKVGDVISFVQEHERISFREALELLAHRAGISLEKLGVSPHSQSRALMLEAIRWAADQFQHCLLESEDSGAEKARRYLGERQLLGETVRRFGLGYAPLSGDWLVPRAQADGVALPVLEEVGILGQRAQGNGLYCRFRDRVMFPIRDMTGRTVGFGGRILPESPLLPRVPKYYNSAETPLFNKSEQLYGLDFAARAAVKTGALAIVEGYTDVLMAHQMGITHVVATMGTALNARHVQRILRCGVQRVLLVFDADAGGDTGVDRALDLFASHEIELAIATLPEGMDPCDLLVAQGAAPFKEALEKAVDALEFKLTQALKTHANGGVEGKRRAADAVLGIIALAPEMTGQAGSIKRQLMVTRIAQRLMLPEEMVWGRLEELRAQKRRAEKDRQQRAPEVETGKRTRPAAAHERELLEVLLAEATLVPLAFTEVKVEEIEHLGLRQILGGLYALHSEGEPPTLDLLRARLDNPALAEWALKAQDVGRDNPDRPSPDRPSWLKCLIEEFRRRRLQPVKQELHNQLHAVSDHAQALELLRQLQNHTASS